MTWSCAAAHADARTYKIVDATGAAVASGALAADVQSVSWTASAIGSYTMTVTATNESGSDSASASVQVEEAEEQHYHCYHGEVEENLVAYDNLENF